MPSVKYPYFDFILSELAKENAAIKTSFGHHVHWGYWEQPKDAKGDDEDFFNAAQDLSRKLCDIANVTDNQRILDVGCGFGGTTSLLNDCHAGMDLTGLNIDPRQLDVANKKIKCKGYNRIQFIAGDACQLPFDDNSFDRVLAVECIFHFPSRELFFKEALRVLKPGGSITLSDFVSSSLTALNNKILALPLFEKLTIFGHFHFITLRKYRSIASQLGLKMQVHDITKNTLPTYPYLKTIANRFDLGQFYNKQAIPGIWLMHFLSKYRLLTYPIITFSKT